MEREKRLKTHKKHSKMLPQLTTMNAIGGQAVIVIYTSLIFCSLTPDNILNIVVLLILAGITITMLFSDSGIINKAREAAEATKNAQSDTEQGLDSLEGNIELALAETAEKGKIVEGKFAKWTDESGTAIIPGGYCVVKDTEKDENTIASGLVISDEAEDTLDNEEITVNGEKKKGNQFVWVPVPDANEIYEVKNGKNVGKLYNFTSTGSSAKAYSSTGHREPDVVTESTGTTVSNYYDANVNNLNIITDLETKTADGFKALLQKEFDSMIASVKKYGGFYIGRYETGDLSSTDKEHVPVVQKGATVVKANWYYQYQEIKNMAKENNNVTSSMIWGCQWDRTLDWIAQTNKTEKGEPDYSLLTNSSSWGNYKDSEGDAQEDNGTKVQTSGFNPAWQKNHIYDLAGNAYDWTLEAGSTIYRVYRGGYYNNSGSYLTASSRCLIYPGFSDSTYGSRSTIYINL